MGYLIAALILLGLILFLGERCYGGRQTNARETEPLPQKNKKTDECCGLHEICERDSLLSAVSKQIEYYDDEELDEWKGLPANGYTEDQITFFRDILYTLKSEEVAGWLRSLQLREIELPAELRDEALLIVGERRNI